VAAMVQCLNAQASEANSAGELAVCVSRRTMEEKAHHATEEAMFRYCQPPSMSVKKWKGFRRWEFACGDNGHDA